MRNYTKIGKKMNTHTRVKRERRKLQKCIDCKFITNDLNSLMDHMTIHVANWNLAEAQLDPAYHNFALSVLKNSNLLNSAIDAGYPLSIISEPNLDNNNYINRAFNNI